MENNKSFEHLYDKELVPQIEKQEGVRKAFKKKFLLYLILGFMVFNIAFLIVLNEFNIPPQLYLLFIFIFLIPYFIKYNSFRKRFTAIYKEDVIKKIIYHISSDLKYSAKGGFPKNQYLVSELFKRNPDRYKAEDYIEGKIGKTFFRFSEVHSEYKSKSTDSKGNTKTSWHTIFRGIFFEADFNKDFKTKTFVMPDNLERAFGFIGKKLQSMNTNRPDLIKLEDPEFEKYFAVYGEDQVEARYILSTSLMKRLTEFRKKRKHPVAISFVNNSIFVAITEHKNLFEPRIFRTNLNKEIIEEYYSMLELVVGIVDDLNLNNRIWAGSKLKTEN